MDYTEIKLKQNPFEKANPISRIFFLWILPLFQKGKKEDLKYTDLWRVVKEDHANDLGDKLERAWLEELQASKLSGRKPRLWKVLAKLFWKRFLYSLCFYCFDSWVIQVSQPLLLRSLIKAVNEGNDSSWDTYLYAAGICVATLGHSLVLHPTVFSLFHMGMQYRLACSTMIYRKALQLSKSSQGEATVGKLLNLLSNDVSRFDTNMNFLPFVFCGPIQFLIFTYFLWDAVGPSCLAGIGVIVLLIPLQFWNGKYSAKFRLAIAQRTDERSKIMNEIIIGIKVIKMYAWEKPFSMLIDGIRKLEVKEIKKRAFLRGIHLAMIDFAPKFISYVTFVVFVLAGNQLSSDTVFFTLSSLYVVVQILVHFMPLAISGLGELVVAINRIEDFLLLEERNVGQITRSERKDGEDPSILMENVTASWTKERRTLENLSVNVQGDKLVLVCGSVGAGKTSFLNALIAELPASEGNITITGTISYASQMPWIFAGNLRDNILFGLPFEPKRYFETIKFCALEQDLVQLPYGDLTIVGERGVALSGGQKARVNLARALYRRADIILLDDPLSAVDSKVSRQLFEKCIKGEFLKGTLRVLVTHQLQYLNQADHIILLNQGKIVAQGTHQSLTEKGIDFVRLMTAEASAVDELGRKVSLVEEPKEDLDKSKPTKALKEDTSKPADQSEKMAAGSVTAKTYWEYFQTGKSNSGFIFLVGVFLLAQVFLSGNDYWLSHWSNAEDTHRDPDRNETDNYWGRDNYLLVYTGWNIGATALSLTRGVWFFLFCAGISINLHDWMFTSMVRAESRFFDTNASGRIMNRFTKDVGAIDELLPPAFAETLSILLKSVGVFTVVIISNYYLSVPTVFLFVALYFIRRYFVQTARGLKRIESIARSPMFTHVAATMQGLETIRACNTQGVLMNQFDGYQDMHSSAWYLFLAANRWFGVWLEMISCLFLVFVTFSFLFISSSSEGGNIGLAISSVLTLMGSFQWGMRQSAETENYMTSVERALEYAKLKPEAALESTPDKKPSNKWPSDGSIKFQNVFLAYDEKPVLKNLTFEVKGKEKIGVVGRTGAGKTTLISALFRMTEPTGQIFIDGVDIAEIGLHDLRTKISIIPQDPILFSGDVRYNLDPFNQFEDIELWRVIEEVELKDAIPNLDFKVADGGTNFSVGERQLVCLARAILRKNKIIVMDEATANVDPRTDNLIQKTIRSKFSDCTILTIAHRLHSVIDNDRILLLDHGNLMEYGSPHELLQNPSGYLASMVNQTGKSSAELLRKTAEEAHFKRRNSSASGIN